MYPSTIPTHPHHQPSHSKGHSPVEERDNETVGGGRELLDGKEEGGWKNWWVLSLLDAMVGRGHGC